jgi:aminomethyltransferase
MVPFGGWDMPLQYRGILDEHRTVRRAAGLFDISHMGEFEVRGRGALGAVQALTTNDVSALGVGEVQYSLLCTPAGGIVDDLTVYRLADDRFMLTVNASTTDKDWQWVTAQPRPDAEWRNISAETALIAVQGPRAEALVGGLADGDLKPLRYYHFVEGTVADVRGLISRTGYTGEDGFELYVAAAAAERLWAELLRAGTAEGVAPIGLGARDTLRLEASMRLYGNDIDETTTVLEADLGWTIGWKKAEFIGAEPLRRQKEEGVKRKLVGFEVLDRAIARQGYDVYADGHKAGAVTSGTQTPFLKKAIGMAYVPVANAAPGTPLEIDVRGRRVRAQVVPLPFYKR